MDRETLLDIAKRIQAMADIGLLYTKDSFDRERYHELKAISRTIIADELKISPEVIGKSYEPCIDYPTPKTDVRALVINKKKEILMVREQADKRWSLPGGWADIGKTPSEIAQQEVSEEAGIDVLCKYLLAAFDMRMHAHPPQPYYIYKLIFYCEPVLEESIIRAGFDVLDAGWFPVDALPPLSEDRILASQIARLYDHVMKGNFVTLFD